MVRTSPRFHRRRAISRDCVHTQRGARPALHLSRAGEPSRLFFQMWGLGPGGDFGESEPKFVNETFHGGGPPSLATYIQSFCIPKNASMVFMIAAGAGASGGAGYSRATSTSKTGGGGGGSGAASRLLIPSRLLPSVLFLTVAPMSVASSGGQLSTIADSPGTPSAATTIITSGTGTPSNGGAGGTASAGAGGGASSAMALPSTWSTSGIISVIAGQAGVAGGADTPTAGVSITWGSSGIPWSGGAGGGSASSGNSVSAGGNITGAGKYVTLAGGAGVAGGPGGSGQSASITLNPFHEGIFTSGGSGGGAAATLGAGGAGGSGGWCSGGAGGGAGVTGGASGFGGPGFIYIVWW